MNIDHSTLKEIEKLAKLNVGVADQELTIKKIVGILDMLDNINDSDLANIEPLYHPLGIDQPMRNDVVNSKIPRDDIQKQSPQVANGLFLVPQVIE